MFCSINLLKTCRCAVVTVSLIIGLKNLAPAQETVPLDEVARLLSLFADSSDANTDQIATWQGSYEMVESVAVDDPWFRIRSEDAEGTEASSIDHKSAKRQLRGRFIRAQNVEGEFVADLRGNRLYSTYRHVGSTGFQQVNGEAQLEAPIDPQTAYHQESILTSDDFLHVRQNARFSRVKDFPKMPEPPGGYRMVERDSPEAGHRLTRQSTVFDPRRLLESGGRRPHVVFDALAAWVEDGQLSVSVIKEGDDTWQIHYEFDNGDRTVKTVSSIQGQFLLSESCLTSEQRGEFRNSWSYDFMNGVAVPVRHEYTHHGVDGQIERGRTTVLLNLRINEPVSDEDFLAARFNPRPLDRLVDRIHDTVELFVDGHTVVSADQFNREMLPATAQVVDFTQPQTVTAALPPVTGFNFRWSLIIANLSMIAVVAVSMLWQRSR